MFNNHLYLFYNNICSFYLSLQQPIYHRSKNLYPSTEYYVISKGIFFESAIKGIFSSTTYKFNGYMPMRCTGIIIFWIEPQ